MPEKNHYEVMRLPRSASLEEVEQQYHELLYQYHPDRNQGDEAELARAVERTIALVNAYRVLSEPVERKKYDFKVGNPLIEEAQTKGMKLLKSKEKKEAEAKFAEGVASYNAGENAKAVEAFKAALKLEPAFSEASYNLALIGALLGNGNFAQDVIARGLKADPEEANLLRLRKNVSAALTGF
jgi:curved DNA-binding protein CbpA